MKRVYNAQGSKLRKRHCLDDLCTSIGQKFNILRLSIDFEDPAYGNYSLYCSPGRSHLACF